MQMLGGRGGGAARSDQEPARQAEPAKAAVNDNHGPADEFDDDIPF